MLSEKDSLGAALDVIEKLRCNCWKSYFAGGWPNNTHITVALKRFPQSAQDSRPLRRLFG